MTEIKRDNRGAPVVVGSRTDKPQQRRQLNAGPGARLELYDDTGRVMGPTESLSILLEDAGNDGINEGQFLALAASFDDPNLLHRTADRLGAVRQRRPDGSIVVLLPAPDDDTKPDKPAPKPDPTPEREEAMAFSDHPDLSVENLTTVREAQRLLGKPVIGSGLKIIRGDGNARFVNTNELNTMLANAGRGGKATPSSTHRMAVDPRNKGASKLIAEHIDHATKKRESNRASRSKRYGTAPISDRDF